MRWRRLFVALCSVVVALGTFLPLYAKLVAGPKAHVCHCESSASGHARCACPICFPELADEPISTETMTGRCGDDDTGWRSFSQPAVVPPAFAVVPRSAVDLSPIAHVDLHPRSDDPPEPRPPRA